MFWKLPSICSSIDTAAGACSWQTLRISTTCGPQVNDTVMDGGSGGGKAGSSGGGASRRT